MRKKVIEQLINMDDLDFAIFALLKCQSGLNMENPLACKISSVIKRIDEIRIKEIQISSKELMKTK